jgi:hypothetical protein
MNYEQIYGEILNVSQAASNLDQLRYAATVDQADSLLERFAQVPNNATQQQLQALMFSVTQLNTRLKQIEDSVASTNNVVKPSMALENAQTTQLNTIQNQQQNMQSDIQELNNPSTQSVNHQFGDYQVNISPQL